MEEVKNKKSTFSLPNEKIIVKFIPHKRGMAAGQDITDSHVISGGMLSTAVRRYSVPLQRNGSIKNVLSDEEKEYLENALGLNLSVYGDFWTTFRVALYKDDANNIFDLSNAMDYLAYKVLACLDKHDIAPSWGDRHKNLTYQFAITREGEEMQEDKKRYDFKKDAFKLYGKIEDDKDKLLAVLRLLTNKNISSDSKLDWLQHKVEEFIDTKPSAFVNVVNDKSFYTKMLIKTAIDKGVIIQNSNKYSTADGLELCNADEMPTFDNAVKYLDNPINQEVRDIIEAKTNK